jgi:nitrite reductase/ring-hydroxylating ferredoxin subunit
MVPPDRFRHQTDLQPAWQEPREQRRRGAHDCRALFHRVLFDRSCSIGWLLLGISANLDDQAAPTAREGMLYVAEKLVGKISEFNDGDRRIVFVGDHEIGVFREHGTFYAYSNYCLHQGGPACEGLTIAKVEERLMPDKTSKGLYFSDTELHFVCPWHGYEYDMKTGECVSDRKLKLRKYEVIQKGDEVYVRA